MSLETYLHQAPSHQCASASIGPIDFILPVILSNIVLGLSPKFLQMLFQYQGCVLFCLVSSSTLLISAMHSIILSMLKRPIRFFTCVLPLWCPVTYWAFMEFFGMSKYWGFHAFPIYMKINKYKIEGWK